MTVRTIRQLGDPLLRQVARPISEFGDDVTNLIADLRDTLHAFQAKHSTGRGIAAPQIGVSRRAVYLECGDQTLSLINPEFTAKSEEVFTLWDSCFSYFGVAFQVQRHCRVSIRYQDASGQTHHLDAEGDLAELLQHEL